MRTKTASFPEETVQLAEGVKALGHPARIAIMRILAERETCICGEIVENLPLAQSTVSQHLRMLKDAGLIQGTIDGPRVCYCLAPDGIKLLQGGLEQLFTELVEHADSQCC